MNRLKVHINPLADITTEISQWTIGREDPEPPRVTVEFDGVQYDLVLDTKNPHLEIHSPNYVTLLETVPLNNYHEIGHLAGDFPEPVIDLSSLFDRSEGNWGNNE